VATPGLGGGGAPAALDGHALRDLVGVVADDAEPELPPLRHGPLSNRRPDAGPL
jgi:hypothetical protein